MSTPIVALDHIRIATQDLSVATADYQRVLDRDAVVCTAGGGERHVIFDAGNVHVVLYQDGKGAPGLRDICLRVDDLERFRRRCTRLDLAVDPAAVVDPLADFRAESGGRLDRLSGTGTRGLGLHFVEGALQSSREAAGAREVPMITGLDHLVISSSDAVATAFLLGAQLGLDLRMDLSNPRWDARLLFFRCGDLILEVFQSLGDGRAVDSTAADSAQGSGTDRFFGLSWRVRDADGARAALAEAAFDVSQVRDGRKPGTRVFTLRNHTSDVATLMLEPPAGGARRGHAPHSSGTAG